MAFFYAYKQDCYLCMIYIVHKNVEFKFLVTLARINSRNGTWELQYHI